MPQGPFRGVIRFGPFHVDPQSGTLWKGDARIRLQEQPFQVLLALLETPGQLVTREDLQEKIWKGESLSDLDHRLNIAINKIREALRDSSEAPRYLETLPRRGYRFISAVEGPPATVVDPPPSAQTPHYPSWVLITGALLVFGTTLTGMLVHYRPAAQQMLEWRRLTNDTSVKFSPVLSDGARLYFRTSPLLPLRIVQMPVSGGQPTPLPLAAPPAWAYILGDISPDGQDLIFAALAGALADSGPFWALRIADGSSRRIGEISGRVVRYAPDGKQIAFTSGGYDLPGTLWVATSDGSNPRRLVELPGEVITNPCWSPEGSRIAFGRGPRATQQSTLWEVRPDGTGLRCLSAKFIRPNLMPTGWRSDGQLLLNVAGQLWIWRPERWFDFRQPSPMQLTSGDPSFGPAFRIIRDGKFDAVGTTKLGELQRFDIQSKSWQSHLGGISAECVEYSRDGSRLVYTTHPDGELWVRNADGSHPVQLTRRPMLAGIARFSPDGRTIALTAKRTPDDPWSIYLVDADGGAVRAACPKHCQTMDLAWAPDGKTIIFSGLSAQYAHPDLVFLQQIELQTGTVARFPAPAKYYSPRASGDWSALAAISRRPGSPSQLVVYRYSEGQWKELPGPGPGDTDFPSWSHDGKSIWYYDSRKGAIMKCEVLTNRHVEILRIGVSEMTGLIGFWFALTPKDEPMILRRRDIQQIYELEWKTR